jgi:hypothetical protein
MEGIPFHAKVLESLLHVPLMKEEATVLFCYNKQGGINSLFLQRKFTPPLIGGG